MFLSVAFCNPPFTILETTDLSSPTACAMSFCLRLLENGAELVPAVTGNTKRGGYVFVGATNTGESPSSRGAFFIHHPGPLRHRRIDATEGRLDFLQDTPPPSPDRPISNSQFLTYDLIMRAVITGEVTPPEQVNEFPFFVGQLLECPFHQLTIPVQPAQ